MAFNDKLGELVVDIRASTAKFRQDLGMVHRDLKTAGTLATTQTGKISAGMASATVKTSALTKAVSGLGLALKSALGFGALALIGGAVSTMASFEKSMLKVKALTKATDEEFKALRSTAEQFGGSTIFTAAEAADALSFLARAGFDAQQSINSLGAVLNLAAAEGADLATTADQLSNIMQAFGIASTESGHVADVLAAAASNSNTNIQQLAEAMKYAAPTAKSLGLSVEETAAIIGKLGNAGIQSSMAGTTLRQSLITLIRGSEDTQAALEAMGITVDQVASGQLSLIDVLKIAETAGISTSEALALFGVRGLGLISVIDQGTAGLDEFVTMLKNSDGAAKELADTTTAGLAGSFKLFVSAAQAVAISLGDLGITGGLTKVIKFWASFLTVVSDAAKIIKAIGQTITTFIAKHLKPFFEWTEKLWKAWESLTGWITAAWDAAKRWAGIAPEVKKANAELAESAKKAGAAMAEQTAQAEETVSLLDDLKKTRQINVDVDLDFSSAENFKKSLLQLLTQALKDAVSRSLDIGIAAIFGGSAGQSSSLGGSIIDSVIGGIGQMVIGGAIGKKVEAAKKQAQGIADKISGGDIAGAVEDVENITGIKSPVSGKDIQSGIEQAQDWKDWYQGTGKYTDAAGPYQPSAEPKGIIQAIKDDVYRLWQNDWKPTNEPGRVIEDSGENFQGSVMDAGEHFSDSVADSGKSLSGAFDGLKEGFTPGLGAQQFNPHAGIPNANLLWGGGGGGSGGYNGPAGAGEDFAEPVAAAGGQFQDDIRSAGGSFTTSIDDAIGKIGTDLGGIFGGGSGIFGGLGGILGGGGGGGLFGGLLGNLGGLFGGIFGGGGGGFDIPGPIGGGGGLDFGGFGGFFAEGGSPPVGIPSIVGEEGPELFVPRTAGTIVPNDMLGGGGVTVVQHNNFAGVDSVNQAQLMNALEMTRKQVISDVENRATRGGTFTSAIRGA